MSVSLEPRIWVARFGACHEQYGDEFTGSCFLSRIPGGVEIIAESGPVITHAERRQLAQLLRDAGVTGSVSWERHRADGSIHPVRLPL